LYPLNDIPEKASSFQFGGEFQWIIIGSERCSIRPSPDTVKDDSLACRRWFNKSFLAKEIRKTDTRANSWGLKTTLDHSNDTILKVCSIFPICMFQRRLATIQFRSIFRI
jgi:hypothetical protein